MSRRRCPDRPESQSKPPQVTMQSVAYEVTVRGIDPVIGREWRNRMLDRENRPAHRPSMLVSARVGAHARAPKVSRFLRRVHTDRAGRDPAGIEQPCIPSERRLYSSRADRGHVDGENGTGATGPVGRSGACARELSATGSGGRYVRRRGSPHHLAVRPPLSGNSPSRISPPALRWLLNCDTYCRSPLHGPQRNLAVPATRPGRRRVRAGSGPPRCPR